MRLRFFAFISLGLAAAFLAVVSTGLALSTIEAISLGVSIGVLVMSTALLVRIRDHLPTAAAAAAAGVVSALMIIGTQVYVLATVKDLTFIEGLALGAIALIGLTAHELTGERVVHSLEVRAGERQPGHEPVSA